MAEVKYKYAFIDGDKDVPISIDDITIEDRNRYKYRCIGCGHEIWPRAIDSKHKSAHFYHKEKLECSGETYLHQLAKLRIKQKFEDFSSPFIIQLNGTITCSNKNNCPLYDISICRTERQQLTPIDLHCFYDTCVEEKRVEDKKHRVFIADLLLYHSQKQTPPILIEINVNHKCEQEKIDSKFKIIELDIKNEEDIDYFVTHPFIQPILFNAHDNKPSIRFYNFQPKDEERPLHNRYFERVIYFKSGSVFTPGIDDAVFNGESYSCANLHKKAKTNSIAEINIDCNHFDFPSSLHYGLLYLRKKGYEIKNCLLCKYYDNDIVRTRCNLWQKFGTPPVPKQHEAKSCQYYREDFSFIKKIEDSLRTKMIIEV